jgi:hypothetical protein
MALNVPGLKPRAVSKLSKRSFVWLVTFGAMYLLYVLFVAPADRAELLMGLAAAAASTVAVAVFRTGERIKFCPSWTDVLQGWRIPGLALKGACELFEALFLHVLGIRKAPSSLRAVPFSASGNSCRSSARAALAELYTTMTPNSIVLGIAHRQHLLLLHQVAPGKMPRIMLKLGGHS